MCFVCGNSCSDLDRVTISDLPYAFCMNYVCIVFSVFRWKSLEYDLAFLWLCGLGNDNVSQMRNLEYNY